MAPQAYIFISTPSQEVLEWKILSRLLFARAPHLGVMNGGAQCYLDTWSFGKEEHKEDLRDRILRLKQEL